MANKKAKLDPRIDAYIAKSASFAHPILKHLRSIVHSACPKVEETIKWGMPHFDYCGILCSMSAFKAHCAFGFWKGALIVKGPDNKDAKAMGQFGRIASLKDLQPKATIARYVKAAMKLNEEGTKAPHKEKRKSRTPLPMHPSLAKALKVEKKASASFERFSPSTRREYIEWIGAAKTDATRERRLATAIKWIAEGKPRHWKYMKK
jgi:uncharacterized protein YdeI (YjbR/CyaY-like superfamily)